MIKLRKCHHFMEFEPYAPLWFHGFFNGTWNGEATVVAIVEKQNGKVFEMRAHDVAFNDPPEDHKNAPTT